MNFILNVNMHPTKELVNNCKFGNKSLKRIAKQNDQPKIKDCQY